MAAVVAAGPLAGIEVVEFGGICPLPFCGMLLADLGADIVRIEPPGGDPWPNPVTARGKICVSLDLKTREAVADCDILAKLFRTRTRDGWCSLLAEADACVAPVLELHEAPEHGQMRAPRVHIEVDGITQPAPAPRFSVDTLAVPRTAISSAL